jgi:hypothetical protein
MVAEMTETWATSALSSICRSKLILGVSVTLPGFPPEMSSWLVFVPLPLQQRRASLARAFCPRAKGRLCWHTGACCADRWIHADTFHFYRSA